VRYRRRVITELDGIEALAQRLPAPLRPFARIAYDYAWTWHPGAGDLFRAIDPVQWDAGDHNPIRLLRDASRTHLERAAGDAELVRRATDLDAALAAHRALPCSDAAPASAERPIVCLCSEYAIHRSLPIYSGGLGVLAGDWLKEASDRRVPMVAVGLLYRRGYFHQRLDPSGWQHESWSVAAPEGLPLFPVCGPGGERTVVRVSLRGHRVAAQAWRAQVGRVPLFLLDTDLPENSQVDRFVAAQLYVGDRELRLMQYALLGVGGLRVLEQLGIEPGVLHLNEGHASLAALELARRLRAGGEADPIGAARARTVFTTHTPVAAGNERYSYEEVERALGDLPADLGLDKSMFYEIARSTEDGTQPFGVTEMALRTSRSANGVSRLHGEVARRMWQPLWPERSENDVPITHVTNGVHMPTWMPAPMRALITRHLGEDWMSGDTTDPARWDFLDRVPDEELWAVRSELRAELVETVRARSVTDRLARGEPLHYAELAAETFHPDVLTVGFARRVASYKRLHLLVKDVARATALLSGDRPIQVVMAGKAHPKDEGAKRILQQIFQLKGIPDVGARVAFLEDYDLAIAAKLVVGCDVWVNVPRPPMEASGTSGMKAILGGALNLSVLDGWWCEGFGGDNGWAIDSRGGDGDEAQDERDADALYGILEREVVPSFYQREDGIPRGWIARVRASLKSLAPRFSTSRMVKDYVGGIYP
jgi:starch phosphorylase